MSHGLIVVPRSLPMFQRERRSNKPASAGGFRQHLEKSLLEKVPPGMVALDRGSFGVSRRPAFFVPQPRRSSDQTRWFPPQGVRNQIVRVRLFVRCGIIGLTLDDVSCVRAREDEGAHRQTGACTHAAPRRRLHAGECWQGHSVNPGLSRPQGHQAYGPLHRAVADQVQNFFPD